MERSPYASHRSLQPPSFWAWMLAPLLLSAVAALPLLLPGTLAQGLSLAGVALGSAAMVWLLTRRAQALAQGLASAEAQAQAGAAPHEVVPLLLDVLPAWQHHVGIGRAQTEKAVEKLTASFARVLGQLDLAGIGKGQRTQDPDDRTIKLLDLCERELQPVVQSLS
ncbi:MAG: hypothetical protein HXX19_09870, partial [Rhodoferax sp.]|nr:hypothetical protein [Rhodoferax sp.]